MELVSLKPREIAILVIAAAALITAFTISLPVQNISSERHVQAAIMEIPAISELNVLNSGLSSITLKWSQPNGSMNVATYKVYMDNRLIGTVDGNVHTYTAMKLQPGDWHQFQVEACDASGKCSADGAVAGARTNTIQRATQSIIDKIESLVSTGTLTTTQGNSLVENLAAVYQLNKENDNAVINRLQDFIKNTNALTATGVISPEAGQSLVNDANGIISNIK